MNDPSSISQVLDVLRHTAALNTLRVGGYFGNVVNNDFGDVVLTQLEAIELELTAEGAASLLCHITPSNNCSFYIDLALPSFGRFEENTNYLHSIIEHAKCFVGHNRPNCMMLDTTGGSFKIQFYATGIQGPKFVVDGFGSQQVIISLLEAFSLEEVSCFTEFYCHYYPACIVLFEALATSLPNVGVLISNERSFTCFFRTYFNQSERRSPILFPLLHTIRLNALGVSYFYGSTQLIDVLKTLRDEGRPLNVFDTTEYRFDSDVHPLLTNLEDLAGLKVLWTPRGLGGTQQYICGSIKSI